MIFLDMYIMGCVLRFEHGGFNTSVYGNLRHMMIDYQPFPSSLQQAYHWFQMSYSCFSTYALPSGN